MSKETTTVQSFQPEEWDEERFFKELRDLLEWDVKRRLSNQAVCSREWPLILEASFNFNDPNNAVRKACLSDVHNKKITFEELYYRIKTGMLFD